MFWQAADFGSMTTKDLKATVRATIRGLRDANFGAWFAELGPYVHPAPSRTLQLRQQLRRTHPDIHSCCILFGRYMGVASLPVSPCTPFNHGLRAWLWLRCHLAVFLGPAWCKGRL